MTPDEVLAARHRLCQESPAPSKHDRTQPDGRPYFLQKDVAWHLEEDIGDEKHEQSDVEFGSVPIHMQIFLQALQPCIADINATKAVSELRYLYRFNLLYSIKAARLIKEVSIRCEVRCKDSAYNSANKIGTRCRSTFRRSFRSAERSIGSSELAELEGRSPNGRPFSSKTLSE